MHEAGKILMILGAALIAAGAVLTFVHRVPWLGKLPGDIMIQKKNVTVYFPLATSVLISIILTVIFRLWSRR